MTSLTSVSFSPMSIKLQCSIALVWIQVFSVPWWSLILWKYSYFHQENLSNFYYISYLCRWTPMFIAPSVHDSATHFLPLSSSVSQSSSHSLILLYVSPSSSMNLPIMCLLMHIVVIFHLWPLLPPIPSRFLWLLPDVTYCQGSKLLKGKMHGCLVLFVKLFDSPFVFIKRSRLSSIINWSNHQYWLP